VSRTNGSISPKRALEANSTTSFWSMITASRG